jgi:hypothetical protein
VGSAFSTARVAAHPAALGRRRTTAALAVTQLKAWPIRC